MRQNFLVIRLMSLAISTLGASTLALPTWSTAAPAKEKDPRSLWAYPHGVIVTSDGGKVEPVAVKEGEDPVEPATNAEFRAYNSGLVARYLKCLENYRAATPALQKTGAKYSFTTDFTIAKTGHVVDLTLTKNSGSADLPLCVDALHKELEAHAFAALKEDVGLGAHATFDAVIFNDDDAQGHGFQYYEGETKWEAALKKNPAWFRCKHDSDCTVTAELCEVRAVNTLSLPPYRQAIAERKKGGCHRPIDVTKFMAKCSASHCSSKKTP